MKKYVLIAASLALLLGAAAPALAADFQPFQSTGGPLELMVPPFTDPTAVTPILEKFQAAYAGMNSFRAEFEQTLTHQESGSVEKRSGVLLFQKPLLIRWETVTPPELLLLTGKEIWNVLEDEDLAYRYSLALADDSRSLIRVVTGQSPLTQDFDVERQPNDGILMHLLLFPKEPLPQLTEAQLWIDPFTYLIKRAQVMDFYGNLNTLEFTSILPDAPMPQGAFTFTPPQGMEVEDHINDTNLTTSPLLN